MQDWHDRMAKRMDDLLQSLERLKLAEYVQYLDDRKRLIGRQFLAGMARGAGSAVGFTVIGALFVWLLNRLAHQNLPIIGDFLAQLVDIVQKRLE